MLGFLILAFVLAAMMGTFLGYFDGVMRDMMPR
jgi:flagellar biosynthetic protein FliR